MNKNLFALMLAVALAASVISGCGAAPAPEEPVEEIVEEVKELTEDDLKDVIINLGDKYVLEGSEVQELFDIAYDPAVIKSIKAEGTISTEKTGEYVVLYNLIVDEAALKEAVSFEEANLDTWVKACEAEMEEEAEGTELEIKNVITVVSAEEADELAANGEIVYTASDETMIVIIEEEEPEEETETTAEEPKSEEAGKENAAGSGNKPATNTGNDKPSGSGTNSGSTKPGSGTTSGGTTSGGNTTPSKPAECSHNWVQQYKTVHHDAKTHTEQVQVGSNPIYQNQSYTVCDCGARNPSAAHTKAHMSNGESAGTHTEWEEVIVGYDPVYENRTVVDQAAYDEQVPNGYKCSKCGKTK